MKIRYIVSLVALLGLCAVLSNCGDDDDDDGQPSENKLTITSFTPETGVVGMEITITGMNFYETTSGNKVKFNTIPADVASASKTELKVIVPAGASTGKITIEANGQTATSSKDFVIPAPVITDFSPKGALAGSTVTITGSNFAVATNNNIVKFNGTVAQVTTSSPLSMTVKVPATATSGKISVGVSEQVTTSTSEFEVLKNIPLDGLVAFYPFSGNANDGSGNGVNGTVTGAVLTTDRFGGANKAYSFDGNGDFISMGDAASLGIAGKITLSAWVKSSAFVDGAVMLGKEDFSAGQGYSLQLSKDATLQGYSLMIELPEDAEPPFGSIYPAAAPFTSNTWVFITAVLDGRNFTFYKNGVETVSSTSHRRLTSSDNGDFIIGRNSEGNNHFTGIIDDVVIYNRALTSAEVLQLFQQTRSKY